MKTKLMCIGIALAWLTQVAFAQSQPPGAPGASQQHSFPASKLIGKSVKSTHGQELGEIKDLVFNPQTGETFVIVGLGRKGLAPIPWSLISVGAGADEKYVTANLTKDILDSAPTVNDKQLGNFSDPKFTERVYAYYGVPPAGAAMGAPGKAPEGTGTGAEKSKSPKSPETPTQPETEAKPETGKP